MHSFSQISSMLQKKSVKSINYVYWLSEREQITVVQKYVASILINRALREP